MIDLNPGAQFEGKSYTTEEAAEVQQYMYEHAPTGSNWWWHDGSHNEVVSTKVISGKPALVERE